LRSFAVVCDLAVESTSDQRRGLLGELLALCQTPRRHGNHRWFDELLARDGGVSPTRACGL